MGVRRGLKYPVKLLLRQFRYRHTDAKLYLGEVEARPSSSGPVTTASWAKVAARQSGGSPSQSSVNQRPGRPVVVSKLPAVTHGPTAGTPQPQVPQSNVPTPNPWQGASQRSQQTRPSASHGQNTVPMDTTRSSISSTNPNASSRASQKAPFRPQIPNIQSSSPQFGHVAYLSSTDRMPALAATNSSALATVSSTKPSAVDSLGQSKSSDDQPSQEDRSKIFSSLVRRPQYCSAGTPLDLYANFFKLDIDKLGKLVRYSIEVMQAATQEAPSVPVTNRPLRSQCIRLALQDAIFSDYPKGIVTDHQANLYSIVKLPEALHTTGIQYRDEHHQTTDPNEKRYIIMLKEGKTLELSSLVPKIVSQDLTVGQEDTSEDKCYDLGNHVVRENLLGGLDAIPGFFSCVRPASQNLLVNVNSTTGAFYHVLRLDELMDKWDKARKDRGRWDVVKLDTLQGFLKGLRIKALHLNKDNDRNSRPWIKRIYGLAQQDDGRKTLKPPQEKAKPYVQDPSKVVSVPTKVSVKGANPREVQFWCDKKKRHISVLDHFKEEYPDYSSGVKLSDSLWCVVNVGSQERPTYLPAEACEVLPGQAYKRKLSPDQTTEMIKAAVRLPSDNKTNIEQEGLLSVGMIASANDKMVIFPPDSSNSIMTEKQDSFGLKLLDSSFLSVKARQLSFSGVRYADGPKLQWSTKDPTMWSMGNMGLRDPASIHRWTYVRILDQEKPTKGKRAEGGIRAEGAVVNAFKLRLLYHGMSIPDYAEVDGGNHVLKFEQKPGTPFMQFLDQIRQLKIGFLLIILPNGDADRYSKLKLLCDKQYGVRNMCVLWRTIMDSDMQKMSNLQKLSSLQKMSNLCLKVNMKMGGVNFVAPARTADIDLLSSWALT
ncbi:MAG: hypothetical protein Q9221_002109 [Calogaya cf. arnoldii]